MARKSREEREAEREAEAQRAREAREAEEKEFRASLPHTLLTLAARLRPFGRSTVYPTAEGYEVKYFCDDVETTTLDLTSEPWEVHALAATIENLERAEKVKAEKMALAKAGWDVLTPEQRSAMLDLGLIKRPT